MALNTQETSSCIGEKEGGTVLLGIELYSTLVIQFN